MTRDTYNIDSLLNKVAVTAILQSEFGLLAGIGGDLLVFDYAKGYKLIKKENILSKYNIHGFALSPINKLLCVFGEKAIAIVKLHFDSSNTLEVNVECKWRVCDWVLSCTWIEEDTQLAALTTHNQLIRFDTLTGIEIAQVASTEKCILYCGSIVSNSKRWIDTVVIAGTVFQQVIIWAVTGSSSTDHQVLHKLHGHKGVIFSVLYDERSQQILSTSDDRSVRVWSVKASGDLHSAEDWKSASIDLAYSVFGHTARVWQSYCLQDRKIISIGEDSMLCVWEEGGKCRSQRETHQGGGVWCMSVDERSATVITGGADGGISVWPLECGAVSSVLSAPVEVPRRAALLSNEHLVVTTDSGTLLMHSDQSWQSVFSDPKYTSYCLLEPSPSRNLIALASIHGHVTILTSDFKILIEERISNEKIFSLHWLSGQSLLTCHTHGDIFVWEIKNSDELEMIRELKLPECKERWTTAAVRLDSTVVIGDRMGNIHSAPLYGESKEMSTVGRAHSRLGVCSLSVHEGRVWSTGRDGRVKQFNVTDNPSSLTLVSSTKLPLEWAAQLIPTKFIGLVALCFHESSLVLWSMNERRQLVSISCGGGHRSWTYFLDECNFSFAFLKSKTAHQLVCSVKTLAMPSVLEGFHIREVNCVTVCGECIVSGGEDGSVRLSIYNSNKNSWSTSCTEYSHVSSVRCVVGCELENNTLVFSAGGRAQIKVWNIHSHIQGAGTLMEVSSLMLRDERRGQHWLNSTPEPDPETRYMDLDVLLSSNHIVHVLAACSDAFLRIFTYDVERNSINLESSTRCSESCLLRVKVFEWTGSKSGCITAGTDGHITFWTLENKSEIVHRERIHQSGVNALSVTPLPHSKLLVVTGGDDNALHVTVYQMQSEPALTVQKLATWTSSTLHSCVITGVEVVNDWILCCAGDQRVTWLSWNLTEDSLSVQLLAQSCCSVSDVKGLTVLPSSISNKLKVCIFGVGAEILEMKKS